MLLSVKLGKHRYHFLVLIKVCCSIDASLPIRDSSRRKIGEGGKQNCSRARITVCQKNVLGSLKKKLKVWAQIQGDGRDVSPPPQ